MTEPTLESRNEAARKARFDDWNDARHLSDAQPRIVESIRAHALTLDELHGRKEVSEAETFYREVVSTHLGGLRYTIDLDADDREAIALIEAKFAELRAPKEPEWIEWYGGECPVAEGADCEVKFRSGACNSEFSAGNWSWKHFASGGDIIAYRIFP